MFRAQLNKDSSIENHGCFHDKPPPCLVDNKIGLQSYVKLRGTKLHYIEAGNHNDPIILLLHGFPDCWLGWHMQVKITEILCICHHVFVQCIQYLLSEFECIFQDCKFFRSKSCPVFLMWSLST